MSLIKDPKYVFIGGAVGSGNTLLFECLIRDPNVYGINEDALGGTLSRLVFSEKEMGACPHSLNAYTSFMETLRGDRKTLVLKTPSNIRQMELIKKYLPDSKFILTVREPHAAISSGLRRHKADVETVAQIWKSDYKPLLENRDSYLVVSYEEMVTNPTESLRQVHEKILTLDDKVIRFGRAIADPDRVSTAWWRRLLDNDTQRKIEEVVLSENLQEIYDELTDNALLEHRQATDTGNNGLLISYRKMRRIVVIVLSRIRRLLRF